MLCLSWTALSIAANPVVQVAFASSEIQQKNLIDIGGRRLNLFCVGRGSPTVVFLQGAGGNILNWRKVREPISAITRACFYDRTGFGYSDPPGRAITAMNVTDDLHALLHASRIPFPVVLAGHSLGGLYATLYADQFKVDVAGLVLVDPSFADQFEYAPSTADKRVVQAGYHRFKAHLLACSALARDGKLSRENSHECFEIGPDHTADEICYLVYQYTRSSYYDSYVAEYEGFFPRSDWTVIDGAEEKKFSRSFGDMPIEVLTAGIPPQRPAQIGGRQPEFRRTLETRP